MEKGYAALAAAIVEQAAKDKDKRFFTREDGLFDVCMPNVNGKALWKQIEANYKEYGDYKTPTDCDLEGRWRRLHRYKLFDNEDSMIRDWWIFKRGTKREKVYKWFDSHYSKGVKYLQDNIKEYEERRA